MSYERLGDTGAAGLQTTLNSKTKKAFFHPPAAIACASFRIVTKPIWTERSLLHLGPPPFLSPRWGPFLLIKILSLKRINMAVCFIRTTIATLL